MFLLQTMINIGEVAEKAAGDWYNENWVGFVLTALAAVVAAYFAIKVVKVDHEKQRIAREEESKTKEAERIRKKKK